MSEATEQIAFMDYMRYRFPDIADDIIHVANERPLPDLGGRQFAYAAKLRKMGMKKGVHDLFIAVPTNKSAGLWMEMKYGKNKMSDAQKDFAIRMEKRGYETCIAYSWQEAARHTLIYLGIDIPEELAVTCRKK